MSDRNEETDWPTASESDAPTETEDSADENLAILDRLATDLSPTEGRHFLPGTILVNRYRIVNLLGRGGMGEVYRADDLKLAQPVALKFLSQAMADNPRWLERFLQEVKITRQITHPNVCRMFDVEDMDGQPFLSMEYIDGENLASLLRQIGRLPQAKAAEFGCQICHGLAAAHAQGVLHRDLKPANLMLDRHGVARITDFGVATLATSQGKHRREHRTGTPAFMAPEVREGQPASVQSDLYSLGRVLYKMFTGHSAKTGDQGVVRPSHWVPDLHPEIDDAIFRCLALDPADRPASAQDLAQRLDNSQATLRWQAKDGVTVPRRPNWQLERRLGRGGFGEVWLGRHEKTGASRVFKICWDSTALHSLQREIAVHRLLQETLGQRDDIVQLLDWSFEEAPYFIETELSDQGNLIEWARAMGGLGNVSLKTRLELLAQVATALGAAHSAGIVHQDVKPGNVLVTSTPTGMPRVKLNDFGIGRVMETGKLADAGITVEATHLALETPAEGRSIGGGTHLYMAPELLEGKPATLSSDIYALGVMLYQMVVGDFSRALAPGWEEHVEDPLLVEDIAATVAGSPSRRLSLAQQLADRLRRLESRHLERQERLREQLEAKKNRTLVLRGRRRRRLALVAIVMLSVFSIVLWWQARRTALEAQTARQISAFLENLYTGLTPDEARGRQVTAYEMLARGVEKVEKELADQPRIQATLLHTIGHVYQSLGGYDEATPLLENALELRRRLHGDRHPDTTSTLAKLADVLHEQADYDRAEALAREAVQIERLLDDNGPALAESLEILAHILHHRGTFDEAATFFDEALVLQRSLQGDEHPKVAEVLDGLAYVVLMQGHERDAERLFEEALDIRRETLGVDHPDLAQSFDNLAYNLRRRGNFLRATEFFENALEKREQILGPDHPTVALSLHNLARCYAGVGNLEEAEGFLKRALEIYQQQHGTEHPSVAVILNDLGSLQLRRGLDESAERLFDQALDIRQKVFGEKSRMVAFSLESLGSLWRQRQDFDQAQTLYERARTIHFENEDLSRVTTSKILLAYTAWEAGQWDQAEALFRESLEERRALLGETHRSVAEGLSYLSRLVRVRGRLDEAEALQRQTIDLYTQILGEDIRIELESHRLASILVEQGDMAQARELLEPSLERLNRLVPTDSWQSTWVQSTLAASWMGSDRSDEAEPHLLEALNRLRMQRGPHSSEVRDVAWLLAKLYSDRGEESEAARYLEIAGQRS